MKKEQGHEEEIDLRDVWTILYRYRRSILSITLLVTMIAAVRLYFEPSVYEARSLLKIAPELRNYGNFLHEAVYPEVAQSIDNELPIFKSRVVADRVLEKLNLGTRYYRHSHWKRSELYTASPFVVTVRYLTPELDGKEFTLIPVDSRHFRLKMAASGWNSWKERLTEYFGGVKEKPFRFEGVYRYGETIKTPKFILTVRKLAAMEPGERYGFSVVPNRTMASFIQSGISASANTKNGNVVSISFRDTVPQRAKDILDNVIKAYIRSNIDYKAQSAAKQLAFIEQQLRSVDQSLRESSKKLENFKASKTIISLDEKATALARKESEFESQLYELTMKIASLKMLLARLKKEQRPEEISIDYPQSTGPVTASLLQQFQEALSTYRALRVGYTREHPKIRALEQKILALRASLKDAIESNLLQLEGQKRKLQGIIAEQRKRMKSFPEDEQKLGQLTRIFMVNKKVYSFLLEKRAEMQIDRSSIVARTRILNPPTVTGEVRPRRPLFLSIGLILGLLLGMAQAFAREILGGKVTSLQELKNRTDIPIYAALPEMRSKRSFHHYLEAMRGLWVNLTFLKTPSGRGKILCITSTIPGEGKTLTAANLARTIAKGAENRVVILDLDMRRAKLHKVLGVPNEIGVSTLLSRHCTLEEAIQPTEIENLHVISSGPQSENPVGLILSFALEPLLEELSRQYDYVILDTPPVGLVSDAVKVMYQADLTLFVLRVGLSKRSFVENLYDLEANGEIRFGLILNGIKEENEYGYYKHYGYLDEYIRGEQKGRLLQ